MELHQIILMSLQIINVLSKKKYVSSSDESIENLLYFKDCQHNKKEEPPTTPSFRRLEAPLPPKAMDCPYPKMCCALTCGNTECGTAPSLMGRQNPELIPIEKNFPPIRPNGIRSPPVKPPSPVVPPLGRKKKARQPIKVPNFVARRDSGFSKDKIKSLINQDDDIRKILKDLVRVTMQKVDLVDKINSKKPANVHRAPTVPNSVHDDDDEDEDDDHLE